MRNIDLIWYIVTVVAGSRQTITRVTVPPKFQIELQSAIYSQLSDDFARIMWVNSSQIWLLYFPAAYALRKDKLRGSG